MNFPVLFKLKIIFILTVIFYQIGETQIAIEGQGVKVTNANVAGQFNGVEAGVRATNSFVGTAVDGTDNSSSTISNGVRGYSLMGNGVFGESIQGTGVYGESQQFRGIWGSSSSSYGVYGSSDTGIGGYFRSDDIAAQLKGHLKLESLTNNHHWQIEINSALNDGYLLLFYNDVFKGSFNRVTGEYGHVSDAQYKENIMTLQDGVLEDIAKLRPVSYTMKDDEENVINHGFIAQELRRILPHIVCETNLGEDQVLSITYTEMIPVLVKGMQEQQMMIKDLKVKIEEQQKVINSMLNGLQHKNTSVQDN